MKIIVLLSMVGFFSLGGCVSKPKNASSVLSYTVRLKPKQDLKAELQRVAKEYNLKAAVIVSGVGSLEKMSLRLANDSKVTTYEGYHEIVSLTGTLSAETLHVHLSASDKLGKTLGGHLVEGNVIYTTCELVLLEQTDLRYEREEDSTYGWKELVVKPR